MVKLYDLKTPMIYCLYNIILVFFFRFRSVPSDGSVPGETIPLNVSTLVVFITICSNLFKCVYLHKIYDFLRHNLLSQRETLDVEDIAMS